MLYVAAALRPALFALHGLDLELGEVVATTSEAMVGEIRLAWWREALAGLDTGKVPAQPLLALLAAEVLPRGVRGADLARLEDRWLGLIGSDAVPAAHVAGGGDLFALAGRLLGGNEGVARWLGELRAGGETAPLPRIAPALRPLLGLTRLAQRDAARARAGRPREPRGAAPRQLRLLAAIASGR